MIELMITLTVLAVVMGVMMTVIFATNHHKTSTMNNVESVQAARVAVDMMARDLRSAGYGADITWTTPQPAIAYVDSQEVILTGNFDPYPDSVGVGPHGPPLAFDPVGSPAPYPLAGTAWTPVRKYRTGAELVRWTLDLNNDGQVDSGDQTDLVGPEAAASRNPDDYVLVREVYGDSTGGHAGDNGGAKQNVALILHPGGAHPPMFQVYLRGNATPWDWSAGPIPPATLPNIERVVVQVAAASSEPDSRGRYATTTLSAQVNSLRNTPDFGTPQYTVDGYVFDDTGSRNGIKDAGEPGLEGVNVRVGLSYTGTTDSDGHYLIRVPEGRYTVRHSVPSGYAVFTHPDSFVVTVPPATTCSFADTTLPGGHVNLYAFNDTDLDGAYDAGESMFSAVRMTVNPGGATGTTGSDGHIRLFAAVGAYTVTATMPDSFAATSPNPVSGTIASGDSAAHWFGLAASAVATPGTISGEVFVDTDRDGTLDGNENGMQDVWVGVSPDSGITVKAYATTDASGRFSLSVSPNDPPGTEPYYVYIVPPSGFYATSPMSLGPVLLQAGQSLSNYNFGLSGFQVIQLSAQRVLSLASGDLVEKDWSGGATSHHRGDADLVLGADAFGTDQVSAWFNQYNAATLFNATRDYNRTAAQAVLCLSVDTLDTGATSFQGIRDDVVTGTRYAPTGNFFVWLNQNSSGNEGYLPSAPTGAYMTIDNGDVQALVTADLAGPGAAPDPNDILVGTKSPIPGQGTLELWQSSGGTAPTYSRIETYPTVAYTMGEVTGIARGDIDGDGLLDLAVSAHTLDTSYSGEVLLFKFMGKTASPRFLYMGKITMHSHLPTSIGLADVDGDGHPDLVCGTVTGIATGELRFYHNDTPIAFGFGHRRSVAARGPIQCLVLGDFGGIARPDVAVGWRQDTGSYVGGITIYYTDTGTIPLTGVDPSGGRAVNWCAALTASHFNYGIYPGYSGPMLMDLAAGVKSSSTDAAIWLFIR